MELKVVNREGREVAQIGVDDQVFGLPPHAPVVHQTLLAQLANRRTGSANTKTRGEVTGSTAKLRRQKGIGRARLGSAGSPMLRHGGIVFGPKPRSFKQALPKRMRRLAIRSVLSVKAAEGALSVVDTFDVAKPKTKEIVSLLANLGLDRSTLLVTADPDRNVLVSARNLEKVKVLPASFLNVVDMLTYQNLLMTVGAVRRAEQLWGGERAGRRRAPIPALEPVPAPSAPRTRRRRTAEQPEPVVEKAVEPAVEKPSTRRRATATAKTEKPPAPRRRATATAKAEKPPAPRRRATAAAKTEKPAARKPRMAKPKVEKAAEEKTGA